jgi:DNA-binding NarL/FixJ family response regulator
VATVGGLRALAEEQLREFWGVGPNMIADISVALRDPVLRPEDPLWCLALSTSPSICERDEELIRMRRQGASLSQIARRFNVSPERVRQILQRDGW